MNIDGIRTYINRVDNEWQLVQARGATEATKNPKLPWSFPAFMADYFAWKNWYNEAKDSILLGDNDLEAARDWQLKLNAWEARMGPILADVPKEQVPEKPTSIPDDIAKIGNSATGVLVGLAALLGVGLLIANRRR